jgi:hypothetical protein
MLARMNKTLRTRGRFLFVLSGFNAIGSIHVVIYNIAYLKVVGTLDERVLSYLLLQFGQ